MGNPTPATIKRLYAVSGNQCAFSRCSIPLVEPQSGKVTGKICHIKGRKPGGARYDPSQTDEERRDFSNLVLMCPIHHDVIDDDPDSYTVERLLEIKAKHETQAESQTATDEIAREFLVNAAGNTLTDCSFIFSQGQMGGQIAHSITNIGPQPREISTAAANVLVAELRHYPSEQYKIMTAAGDSESHQLLQQIKHILSLAGWSCTLVGQAFYFGDPPKGISVEAPEQTPQALILLNWLQQVGLQPESVLREDLEQIIIVIGLNI